MTPRPTPARLAEIDRMFKYGNGDWRTGKIEYFLTTECLPLCEMPTYEAVRELFAEIDALTRERDGEKLTAERPT